MHDVVILGAGAAGLMCAIEAGKRGRKVVVIDHAKSAGEKIRISGGGRCNFTNRYCSPANFLSENPRFCISALRRYTQRDFIALVERHRIAWHEKTLGQLFCNGSSRQIIDMLISECAAAHVELRLATSLRDLNKADGCFTVVTSSGELHCRSLVIATGGPSIPKMGATGFAYDIGRRFSLAIVTPRAGLVPLTFDPAQLGTLKDLAGLSTHAKVACGKQQFEEALLFTHRGLSGPAILQISSYWREGQNIVIDLSPAKDIFEYLRGERASNPRQDLHTALSQLMPRRLAQYLVGSQRLADCSDKLLRETAERLHRWTILPAGTEGFRTAEVTVGGIDTRALSSQTMEATAVPGLYFIGEAVDVTGHLGGHNFQWAWSSGWAAGQVV